MSKITAQKHSPEEKKKYWQIRTMKKLVELSNTINPQLRDLFLMAESAGVPRDQVEATQDKLTTLFEEFQKLLMGE